MPTRCRLSLHGNCCGPNGASLGGQKRPPGPSQILSSSCPSCQRAWSTTRWFAQSPCWCHTRAGTEPLLQPQTQTLLRCVRCPVPSQFVQYRPNSPRAQPRLSYSGGGAGGHFYRDGLIPFFGALSVGHEGLDGPTDRVGAAGEVRPRRQTVRSHSTVDPSHTA